MDNNITTGFIVEDNGEGLRAEVVKMICASPSRNKPCTTAGGVAPGNGRAWAEAVIKDAEMLIAYIKGTCDGTCEGEA